MKVKVYPTSGCTRELRVEVEAETVAAEVDGLYHKISHEASLPGFRKGKAPLEIVRRKYKDTVREEILRDALPRFFREAVQSEKIAPIAQPRVTEFTFEEGAPMRFVAVVEVRPEFELKDYKGLKLTGPKTEVTEADVDQALLEIREQSASFVPMEGRPVKMDDMVLVDFEGRVDGTPFEGGKATRYPIAVGKGNVLKDFEDALVGMNVGEKKTFPVKFPADYPQEKMAGKGAEFTVHLHEIKERILPNLDDQLAKDVFKCESVADLRVKMAEDLKARRENDRRGRLTDQLAEQLIGAHSFDAPPSLIEMELQRLVKQAADRFQQQGVDLNKWPEDRQKDFIEQFRKPAEKNVRMSMIVDRIGEAEKIACTDEDFDQHLDRLSKALQQPKDAVRRFLDQRDQKHEIEDRIQYEKTLDFILGQSKIETA